MNPRRRIAALLRRNILILDGAMGTELQKRGLPAGVCPEGWGLANPAAITQIHGAYRAAGADIVYSATFGANRVKMGRYGLADVRRTNRELSERAKRAAGDKGIVAGDIGPTGQFVEPFGELPFAEAVEIFREQAQGLLEGGVDCFVIETMMDIQEARAALIAVRELSDLFTIVTMTYEKHGRTLNGTDPVTALVTLQGLGADAVGCNCSAGPEAMLGMIAAMKPHARVPLVAKPNAGLPRLVGDQTVFDMDPEAFAAFGSRFAAAGVNLMGGCCGTTPAHIAALRGALSAERPVAPQAPARAAASSARSALIVSGDRPLLIVGGRLDPAENEALRQGLLTGETGPVRQAAREQEKEGAQLLRLRGAAPGLDEGEALAGMVRTLSPTTRLPFLIDTDRLDLAETLLRGNPGCALIAAGASGAGTDLLSIAKRFGAVPVLRCGAEGGQTVCRSAIRAALTEARGYGFSREQLVVEVPVPGAVPDPARLWVALGLVSWCTLDMGCRTLLDLTGVGRGLPERQWLQVALLAAAQSAGLTFAVADPALKELMHARAAGNLLRGLDQGALDWRKRFGAA